MAADVPLPPDQAARARLAAIVESSDDAILGVTLDGIITDWNPAAERLYGYSAEEAIGKSIRLIVPADRDSEREDILRRIGRGEPMDHFETVRQRKDGDQVDVSISVSPIRDVTGAIVGAATIARDISDRKAAEVTQTRMFEELRQKDARLQLITDALPALVSYVDAAQRYRFNNRTYEEWFGQPRAMVYGRHLAEVLGEQAFEQIRPHVEAVLAGRPVSFETEVTYPDQNPRYISASYVPHLDEEGHALGFVALVQDVTDRKRTELALMDSEERFRVITENARDLIAMMDLQGRFAYASPSYLTLLGHHPSELVHTSVFDLVHPDDASRLASWNEEPVEFRARRRDGSWMWLEGRSYLVALSRGSYVVVLARDVSGRKRAEAARVEAAEREGSALAQAQAALHARDEFLSVAAHELKTPITSLRLVPELILRRLAAGRADPVWLRQRVEQLGQQSTKLAALVANLLDISRIEGGRLTLDRRDVDLVDLVNTVVTSAREVAPNREIHVAGPAALVAAVDPVRLEQVLVNLVDNAVKYSPPGTPVELMIRQVDGISVELSVTDHGSGISAEDQAHIFEPFFRSEGTPASGLGLGLYISRQIIELHGGELRVERPPSGGTRFTVALPMSES